VRLGAIRGRLAFRLRHPKTTVRWRLTLLYGGLFLTSGAALLAITYTLVDHATLTHAPFRQQFIRGVAAANIPATGPRQVHLRTFIRAAPGKVPAQVVRLLRTKPGQIAVAFVGSGQRIADLHQLVIESVIALAIMAVISAALGWLVSGRVLLPLRTMTATTRQISEANLHQRLAMQGPRDELKLLADTIDGLLGRLEGAFDAQRRFVANASHELRTPLTAARALLEMVISDPHATVETFRATCEQVLEEGAQQEQLIDALLALAHGQRGIDRPQTVDLTAIASHVLLTHGPDAAARGVQLDVALEPALVSGDRRLIELLTANLVDNALRHNVRNGRVQVKVGTQAGQATLAVANTGLLVPADEIERLLAPFQRLAADRVGNGDGLGLGLSIVAAIANAHEAALDVHPGPTGGLAIEVRFPRMLDGLEAAAAPEAVAPTAV
jgi:signal transduction histidine kinase